MLARTPDHVRAQPKHPPNSPVPPLVCTTPLLRATVGARPGAQATHAGVRDRPHTACRPLHSRAVVRFRRPMPRASQAGVGHGRLCRLTYTARCRTDATAPPPPLPRHSRAPRRRLLPPPWTGRLEATGRMLAAAAAAAATGTSAAGRARRRHRRRARRPSGPLLPGGAVAQEGGAAPPRRSVTVAVIQG
jgi:hypothetical protein